MVKTRINKLLVLLMLSFALFIPIVFADPFDTISASLDSFGKVLVGEGSYNAVKAATGVDVWRVNTQDNTGIIVTAMWFMILAIIYGVTQVIPMWKDVKGQGGRIVFCIAFTFLAFYGTSMLAEWLLGIIQFVPFIMIAALVFMAFTLIRSFRTGYAESGAKLFEQQTRSAKEQKKAEGEKRDLNLAKVEIKKEKGALNKLEKIVKKDIKLDEDLMKNLTQILDWLKQIASAGLRGTPESKKAIQRILNMVKPLVPLIRKKEGLSKELGNAEVNVNNMFTVEYRADAAIATVGTSLIGKAGLTTNTKIRGKANALALEILNAVKEKRRILDELNKVKSEIDIDEKSFNKYVSDLVRNLKVGNLDNAISDVQGALKYLEQEKIFSDRIEALVAKMRGLNVVSLKETLVEENLKAHLDS